MTDLARLGIAVESSGVDTAARALGGLTSAAQSAEAATNRLSGASRGTAGATRDVGVAAASQAASVSRATASAQMHAAAMRAIEQNSRMAAMQQRNLLFQLNDIGVSLASGMNPLMVMAQQGSQIATIYEGGVVPALREMARMAGQLALRFGPLLAVVGLVSAAIAGMTQEINETSAVTVTFGDTALAVWQVISSGIYQFIKPAVDAISGWFGAAWNWITQATKDAGNAIIRSIIGAIEYVKTAVSTLPDAFIMAGRAAAQGLSDAIAAGVNNVLGKMNELVAGINQLAGQEVLSPFNLVDPVQIEWGAESVERYNDAWDKYRNTVDALAERDIMGEFFGAVQQQAIKNANERLAENADETGKAAKEAERLAEAYDDIVAGAEKFIEEQENERKALGMSEEQANALRYSFELLNKAREAGIVLSPAQVSELTNLGRQMAAAEAETKRLTKAFEEQKQVVDDVLGAIGDAFSGLFDGTIKDFDGFISHMLDGFGRLGQANLGKLFSSEGLGSLFNGGLGPAANDNGSNGVPVEVTNPADISKKLGELFGGSGGLGGLASAGLGGLGIGYQTQNPLMGGLGGALSGFAAGGPIGAVIGGIAGVIGGIFGMNEALEKAKAKLEEIRPQIEQFVAAANGEVISQYAKALADATAQAWQMIRVANEAKDWATATEIEGALARLPQTLAREFQKDLQASINELQGSGYLNEIVAAQDRYNARLADAAKLGTDGSLALTELNLTLQKIAEEANLSESELARLAQMFPQLAPALAGATSTASLDQAIAEARRAVEVARNNLRAAYEAEATALQQVIERNRQFIRSIEDFKQSMRFDRNISPLSPMDRLREAERDFVEISQKALAGDQEAIGQLEAVSRQYLEDARAYYGTSESYMRIWEQVDATLDQALARANVQVTAAEQQLGVLNTQVSHLIDINNSVMSVAAAIAALDLATQQQKQLEQDRAGTLVDKLYRNVLGREADAAGKAWWEERIGSEGLTPEIYRMFAEAARARGETTLPGYANGTNFHPGGLARINEYGRGEIVNLPRGAQVIPHDVSMRMATNDNREMVDELRALRAEVAQLRGTVAAGAQATVGAVQGVQGTIASGNRDVGLSQMRKGARG